MEEQNSFGTIILSAIYFSLWKGKMLDLLVCKDLFRPVQGMTKPENKNDNWKLLHRKVALLKKMMLKFCGKN